MTSRPDPPRTGPTGVPVAVAAVAIGIWIAFVVVMLLRTDAPDLQWTRLTFVFSSVEAIAFAAAGALFGVTVQQERVRNAEERADANAVEAVNGRALAAITIADGEMFQDVPRGPGFPEESFGLNVPADDDVRRRHAMVARALFPGLAAADSAPDSDAVP